MNIIYSCDDHYVQQTGISILSVLENNKKEPNIIIYLISKSISLINIKLLNDICRRYNRCLKIIDFDSLCYDLNISAIGRHIETIYSKVFFSRIPELNKAIYLDSDTIVVDSLAALWSIDLEGYYLGAVETFSRSKGALGIPLNERFFNDGMAIINVKYCRENHLIEKMKNVLEEYNGNPPVLSEGALNKVCLGKVKFISLRYNLMAGVLYFCLKDAEYLSTKLGYSKADLLDSCKNPVVIHYLTAFYNRPWFAKCNHPYKNAYLKYKSISPWKDLPLLKGNLSFRIRFIDFMITMLGYKTFDKIRTYILNI